MSELSHSFLFVQTIHPPDIKTFPIQTHISYMNEQAHIMLQEFFPSDFGVLKTESRYVTTHLYKNSFVACMHVHAVL